VRQHVLRGDLAAPNAAKEVRFSKATLSHGLPCACSGKKGSLRLLNGILLAYDKDGLASFSLS
jgi:hypothetical protein